MTATDLLTEGYPLPGFVRKGTLHHWNRYAAVNDEFADHHMDDEAGRHEGFAGAFIMGPLEHDYVHAMLRTAIGEEGRIVRVDIRLRNPLLARPNPDRRRDRHGGTARRLRARGRPRCVGARRPGRAAHLGERHG